MDKGRILSLARARRSVRRYSREPIDLKEVIYALKAASQAPSGSNRQPWRFMIVTDPEVKVRIREASESCEREFYASVSGEWRRWLAGKGLSWSKPFLEEAPVLVLVFSEMDAPYHRESVWLATGYILLALQERGLETLTYTPSDTKRVAESVEAPTGFSLEAVVPIGFSLDSDEKEKRRKVGEVTFLNRWGVDIGQMEKFGE